MIDLMLSASFDSSKISKYLEVSNQWVYTEKYDGICVVTTEDGPRTRNGKQINNPWLRSLLSKLPPGLQGEIACADVSDPTAFKIATSLVMTKYINEDSHRELLSKCKYFVFNCFDCPELSYVRRLDYAAYITDYFDFVEVVSPQKIDLNEAYAIGQESKGEGIIVANADAPYYFGRCNTTNPHSLKIKKMDDCDSEIIGFEVEKYGQNLKSVPEELWGTEKPQVSKIILSNDRFGVHKAGGGLTLEQKKDIFNNPDKYLGKICTIEFMACGVDSKPRQPHIKTLIREDCAS